MIVVFFNFGRVHFATKKMEKRANKSNVIGLIVGSLESPGGLFHFETRLFPNHVIYWAPQSNVFSSQIKHFIICSVSSRGTVKTVFNDEPIYLLMQRVSFNLLDECNGC